MSEREPNGTVGYRLSAIERRLERIESYEPAVMRREIQETRDDIHSIAQDISKLHESIARETKALRENIAKETSSARALMLKFFVGLVGVLLSSIIYILVATNGHP